MDSKTLERWRRHLHENPELALDTVNTRKYILEQLDGIRAEISEPIPNSIALYFDFGREKTMALRADMDALPVMEETGAPYSSKCPGRMHACGHDGHMTMLMGAAMEINRMEDAGRNVLIIFQPGEENPGGARLIMETGLFEKHHVDMVFGMHLWPNLKAGAVGCRPGPMMARSSEVNIDITGRAAHAAKYREGIDALEAGMNLLSRIYESEKEIDDNIYRLLRFGHMSAGTIRNVVASNARLEGTLRAFEPEVFEGLKQMIIDHAGEIEQETGASVTLSFSTGYPAVLNDEKLAQKLMSEVSLDIQPLPLPEMISEDFSFYMQEVPGVFFFFGTGTGIPLHDSHFDFDADILADGCAFWTRLVRIVSWWTM